MRKAPVAAAIVVYRAWSRLPPEQRRALLDAARRHGPGLAAKAAAASKRAVGQRRTTL